MNTKSKVLVTGNDTVVGHNLHRVLPGNGFEVTTLNAVNDAAIHEAPKNEPTLAKTIGMLFAAPFIGLAYVIALPFIGIYHFVKLAIEAHAKKAPATNGKMKKVMRRVKNIGLFFAAPFVALGYVIALPLVGLVMISKLAKEAHAKGAITHS
ncbi:MAG: hypothetical protein WBS20_09005 [Lysobacterales bacterium]